MNLAQIQQSYPSAPAGLRIERHWEGARCRAILTNTSNAPLKIGDIVLFDIVHGLPGGTKIYSEGFQLLSQTGGTLAEPKDLGFYNDRDFFHIAEPEGYRATSGLLLLSPETGGHLLLGYASCHRFNGRFFFNAERIQVVLEGENLTLSPGDSWQLEEFVCFAGPDRASLLNDLASAIESNHPRLKFDAPPTGWCSWYCFGPKVTAQNIYDNLDYIARNAPELKYIQIDDGFQPFMGDWLDTGAAFGGGVRDVLKEIRARGFEPAIWVAPFIAEGGSRIFQEHPDWFVKNAEGEPLRSDTVWFGGWRCAPWYVLDGTHPEAQKHLERVFTIMREEWGCTYFKLDANNWGAIQGGFRHDPGATRIEAYRRGMEAILRGTKDSFVLGCNQPIWGSFGLVHGSRTSMDISRKWEYLSRTGRENLLRCWQNGRLWWNDPDCLTLFLHETKAVMDAGGQTSAPAETLTLEEFRFHASLLYATGGMLLSGDDLTRIPADRLPMLHKMIPPTGVPASFESDSFETGVIRMQDRDIFILLNWDDSPAGRTVHIDGKKYVRELWTEEDYGVHSGQFMVANMPPRSGRVLIASEQRPED